jgi:hypothetical protein
MQENRSFDQPCDVAFDWRCEASITDPLTGGLI